MDVVDKQHSLCVSIDLGDAYPSKAVSKLSTVIGTAIN